MSEFIEKDRFIEFLSVSTSLSKDKMEKLIDEILEFFNESEFEFIRRKHKELRELGYTTDEIYTLINSNIENYLFKGKKFSKRKYKRIIYGE